MDCRSSVLNLVQSLLAQKGDLDPLDHNSPLFTSGRLQSINGVQVAVFLEENFGVDFAEIGFDQEKIDTVESICSLIAEAGSGQRVPL